MLFQRPRIRIEFVLSSLVLMLSFYGCADDGVVYDNQATDPVSGNWQVSASTSGVPLSQLSGALNSLPAGVTGVLHSNAVGGCSPSTQPIAVSGVTDSKNVTTLTGPVAGGTLAITGTLAQDGRSLTNATVNVTGGQCAFASASNATVQNYNAVTGTYVGTLSDAKGPVMNVSASLSQATLGDANGNLTLSGTVGLGTNSCFVSPVPVVNSQVSGNAFVLTYTDNTKGNSVTATGTVSVDGATLTVTNWSLTGPCGADTGTGTLTKQ